MKFLIYHFRFAICAGMLCFAPATFAQPVASITNNPATNVYLIDLPTALRLAGAQNLDIKLAREKLAEAQANYDGALLQFFPSLSPGVAYRRHDNLIQDTTGNILEVHKQSYAPGATIGGQVDIGDAIFKRLAARQLAKASAHGLAAQQDDATLSAAQGFFEMAFAQRAIAVAQESVAISSNYRAQIENAVATGIAFKGDLLRVTVQTERNHATLDQAIEQKRVAAARLAEILHLDPGIELTARDNELVPLVLVDTNAMLKTLVDEALASRPELKQSRALAVAAREVKKGTVYGPLIPSLNAQAFVGGLGGGQNSSTGNFGEQEDYFVGVTWKIGPGGLFDRSRVRAAEARAKSADINTAKLHDTITRQVVEAFARLQSGTKQIETNKRALAAAEEGFRLSQGRKEFGVGIVLETIQTEQDLTRARLDYLKTIAEFSKAEYALKKAIGGQSQ